MSVRKTTAEVYLSALDALGGVARAGDVATHVRVSRVSAYRILELLSTEGHVTTTVLKGGGKEYSLEEREESVFELLVGLYKVTEQLRREDPIYNVLFAGAKNEVDGRKFASRVRDTFLTVEGIREIARDAGDQSWEIAQVEHDEQKRHIDHLHFGGFTVFDLGPRIQEHGDWCHTTEYHKRTTTGSVQGGKDPLIVEGGRVMIDTGRMHTIHDTRDRETKTIQTNMQLEIIPLYEEVSEPIRLPPELEAAINRPGRIGDILRRLAKESLEALDAKRRENQDPTKSPG